MIVGLWIVKVGVVMIGGKRFLKCLLVLGSFVEICGVLVCIFVFMWCVIR